MQNLSWNILTNIKDTKISWPIFRTQNILTNVQDTEISWPIFRTPKYPDQYSGHKISWPMFRKPKYPDQYSGHQHIQTNVQDTKISWPIFRTQNILTNIQDTKPKKLFCQTLVWMPYDWQVFWHFTVNILFVFVSFQHLCSDLICISFSMTLYLLSLPLSVGLSHSLQI